MCMYMYMYMHMYMYMCMYKPFLLGKARTKSAMRTQRPAHD